MHGELGVPAVAQGVELLECLDGGIKDAFAALFIDVAGAVAGHGGDDGDAVTGVVFGNPLVAGLVDNGGVEPGHDLAWLFERSDAVHESTKAGDHFGGAAGEVEGGDIRLLKPVDDAVDHLVAHDFLPCRACIDVAVDAGEVTEFSCVELQDFRGGSGEGGVGLDEGVLE